MYGDIIQDVSVSEARATCLNSSGFVIQCGLILHINPGDYYEGCFPEDKIISKEDKSNYIDYEYVTPYSISFASEKIKIKKISAGERHCLALDSRGDVYCWGENNFGQLGLVLDTDIIIGNPKKIKFDFF